MAEIKVNVRGKNCPTPLIETRLALKKAAPGDIIEVTGTHPPSRHEIPMAVEALKLDILSNEGTETDWTIRIRR
jgi:TusA-related sulfurtransferase